MGDTFEAKADLPLDERLLTALEAGVAAGGDRRGQRSALLRVVTGEYATDLEIRVHEHAEPLAELRRLLGIYHQETDLIHLALKAAGAIRSSAAEAELEQLADLSTYAAITQLRELLAQRGASDESLKTVDRLLAAFPQRPDAAEMRFGVALKLLAAAT